MPASGDSHFGGMKWPWKQVERCLTALRTLGVPEDACPARGCVMLRCPRQASVHARLLVPHHRVCFLLHEAADLGESRGNASMAGMASSLAVGVGSEAGRAPGADLQCWVSGLLGAHPPGLSPPSSAGPDKR